MKDRGILFSGEMVRAILDGRKTQTRRLVKPQPEFCENPEWFKHDNGDFYVYEPEYSGEGSVIYRCPYGQPGDHLWVRETWAANSGGPLSYSPYTKYKADAAVVHRNDLRGLMPSEKWSPSIHMPRWASRITLEVTGVRVERLQEISTQDAIAEGLSKGCKDGRIEKYGFPDSPWHEWRQSPVDYLHDRWSREGSLFSWSDNPWVWVVEFKRVNQ